MREEQSYTFSMVQEDGTTISLTGNKITLPEIIEDFEAFLLGCTFHQNTINRCFGEYSVGDEYNEN